MKQIIYIFLLLFIINTQSICQQYYYHHYDVTNGLSGNTVYTISQDNDGFMWFGTETGLSRFDGRQFRNYTAQDGLFDNEIISLFVDSKNRVWIFPFRGSIYYYYQGKIHNSENDSLLKKFHLNNEIFKASEDNSGNIFFLEQKKLHILSADNEVTEIDTIDNYSFYTVSCGTAANGNFNLYIIQLTGIKDHSVGIYEYGNSRLITKGSFQDSNYSRTSFEINKHYRVIKNGLVFQIYNQKDNSYFELKTPDHFHTLSYINDSCFTLSTFNKTVLFNVNRKKIVDSFLVNKVTNKCFNDRENNLWFASMTEGVYRLSPARSKLYKIESNFNFLPVYAINYAKGNLYVGSERKLLWELNLKESQLKSYLLNIDYNINRISNIQINQNNNLLIGSNIGLFNFNNKKTSVFLPNLSVKSSFIEDNSLIIASDRAAFDISLLNGHRDTIWGNRSTCAYKFNNKYYIGSLHGLYIVQGYPKRTIIDIGKKFPVLKDKIITLGKDSSDNLWIATESNGLIGIKDDKVIYQLTVKNGLTSNLCRCIYISNHTIWVGTDKGISKIDILHQPFKITNFTAADGLDCEIINCIYARGDSVFAGTPYGITFFDAAKIQSTPACNLKLLNIQSKNSNWYFKQDSIHLTSKDNFIRFEYTGISFMSSGDISYYYQLQGFSNEWRSTKQNTIEFQSLRAGKYRLNLYAVNKYGIKSKTVSIEFKKAKPFWQLWWIWGIILGLLIIASWFIIKIRIKKIKELANQELLREKQLLELEQLALRSQMNPHFIFNSLNSIQQYIFAGDVMEANRFITEFSSLVRQTFYISSKKFIPLEEEIKYLETYLTLEQVKYEHVFNFQLITGTGITEDIPVPPLLVQPFIENSIRHGVLNLKNEHGKILVSFAIENNHLLCIVEDNGIGRETARKLKAATASTHQSKGMEMVQKRIDSLNNIYNSDITVSIEDIIEENKTGTRVKLKLPLHYDE